MLIIAQFVLLLCATWVRTQGVLDPSVDIISELGKLRNLEDRLKTAEDIIQQQNTLITELNAKLEELRTENEDRKVAFSASLFASGEGHEGPHDSVQSPLIYKKVFTNFGNGYNSNTGIFTAPVKGVYYFRFYAHAQGGIKMAVSLIKNNETQCSIFDWLPPSNANASNGIVLTLEKGDEIYTKLWDNTRVYDDPAGYTSFGGFLLFPL